MIKSSIYRMTRLEMARLASEEYIRNFWWFVAAVPLFGIAAMIFGDGAMRMVGAMAILWPFSIPARSVIATSKSTRLFTEGCHVELTHEGVVFIGEYMPNGKRLRYVLEVRRIKEVLRRKGLVLIRTRIPGFLPIREEAFASVEDLTTFVDMVNKGADEALGEVPETL